MARVYISSNIGDIPFSNGGGYVNEEIDALFQAAGSSADVAERGELYAQIQQILTAEVPYWWLVETTSVRASGSNVHGIAPYSGHFAEAAWLEGGGN